MQKSDIPFEYISSYKNINAQTHVTTNYFWLNASTSTAS